VEPVRILFRARLSSAWITLAAISAEDKIRRGYLRKVAVTYGWRTSSLECPPPFPSFSLFSSLSLLSLCYFRSFFSCFASCREASFLNPLSLSSVAATQSTCCPSNVPPIGRKLDGRIVHKKDLPSSEHRSLNMAIVDHPQGGFN